MSARRVAERYARALVDLITDDAQLERVSESVRAFADAYARLDELRHVLENPSIPPDKRARVFADVIAVSGYDATTQNFLRTLFRRGRLGQIADVAAALETHVSSRLNRVEAQVTSVTELGEEPLERVRASLESYSGKTVRVRTETDPDLLGGVVVRMGGLILDGSLRSRLERMREALTQEERRLG